MGVSTLGESISVSHIFSQSEHTVRKAGDVKELTVRMWFSSSVEIACAYSVFSFAMRVRLLISGLLFNLKSCSASRKSAATSAAGNDMMGNRRMCLGDGCEG